ncbi:MAG TPA: response regulator [Gaiellaceae bacterium]|nr:response regulator [Gaiellaceae bacterium]
MRSARRPRAPEILVVDDSASYGALLERVLSDAGYVVSRASSVDEALGLLSRRRVDVVLSDLSMPGASGLDLLRILRERMPGLPFVLTGGTLTPDVEAHARRLGAATIGKEATLAELRALLAAALEPRAGRSTCDRLRRESRSAAR